MMKKGRKGKSLSSSSFVLIRTTSTTIQQHQQQHINPKKQKQIGRAIQIIRKTPGRETYHVSLEL